MRKEREGPEGGGDRRPLTLAEEAWRAGGRRGGRGGPPPAQERPPWRGRTRAARQPRSAPSGLRHASAGQEQPRGEGIGRAKPSPGLRRGTPHTLGSLSGRLGADTARPASPTQHSQEKTVVCGARGDSEKCLGAGRPQASLRTFPVSCGLAVVWPERQNRGGDLHRECSREALQCGRGRNKRGVLKPSEMGTALGRGSGVRHTCPQATPPSLPCRHGPPWGRASRPARGEWSPEGGTLLPEGKGRAKPHSLSPNARAVVRSVGAGTEASLGRGSQGPRNSWRGRLQEAPR